MAKDDVTKCVKDCQAKEKEFAVLFTAPFLITWMKKKPKQEQASKKKKKKEKASIFSLTWILMWHFDHILLGLCIILQTSPNQHSGEKKNHTNKQASKQNTAAKKPNQHNTNLTLKTTHKNSHQKKAPKPTVDNCKNHPTLKTNKQTSKTNQWKKKPKP